MKNTIRSLQKGRSMIEVIAIMAIMGILLIAGLVGFKLLLDYLKQKETIEQVSTIAMRHKASRLNAKNQTKGYVPMKQVYPEGNNCTNGTDKNCVITPEGNEVRLANIDEATNFMVLVSELQQTTCEELAMMGGYEFALRTKKLEENEDINTKINTALKQLDKIIQGDSDRNADSFVFSNEGIFGASGETIALTPEYLKKNPTVLKKFCDPDLPLLGFVYTGGDCEYLCNGDCQDCPCGEVLDGHGNCCKKEEIECGICFGCTNNEDGKKYCYKADEEDEGRCVECLDDTHCPGMYCIDNKCVSCTLTKPCKDNTKCCKNGECTTPNDFWIRDLDDPNGACKCIEDFVELGGECEASCNCKDNAVCDNGKCKIPGNSCKDDTDCASDEQCCKKGTDEYGQCCKKTKICDAETGICRDCKSDNECDSSGTMYCCEGTCKLKTEVSVPSCGGKCCAKGQECLTKLDGTTKYCGNSEDSCDADGRVYCESKQPEPGCCEIGEYCHEFLGCQDCPDVQILTCGDSVPSVYNPSCFTKKHLNCLDKSDKKTDDELREMIEDNEVEDAEKTPICSGGSEDSEDTDAECNACDDTEQCAGLKGQGGKNVLNKKYVCRLNHTGDDEKFNGTCGKCIDNSDCGNLPCIDGVCGCETDADCEKNCDGKTTCDKGICVCDPDKLKEGDNGECVCPNAGEHMYRLVNQDNSAQYQCCPKDTYPYNGGCYPLCGTIPRITKVDIWVDRSYSTVVGSTEVAENIEKARQTIVKLIQKADPKIEVRSYTEYTDGTTGVTKTIKVDGKEVSLTFTPFNCGGGRTCFVDATGVIPKPTNKEGETTLTFILSDGILPEATAKNLTPDYEDYTILFAKKGTKLSGVKEEYIITFENLGAAELEERFFDIIDSRTCVTEEKYQEGLYKNCPLPSEDE